MVAQKTLESQLSKLKLRFRIFGRAEAKELAKILNPDEIIIHCVHGYYHGGSGLLVASNERLFLVDKRPFFLNLEEIKYKNIQSVEVAQHMFQATITLRSSMNQLVFRSVSDARVKALRKYVEMRVEEALLNENIFAQIDTDIKHKPYLNPAWRPHHATILRRRNPSKFYRHLKTS